MEKKKTTKSKKERPWWKKPPRSSRICFNCEHKYSSHIDVRCLKIVSRKPRVECECKGFIANQLEMDMVIEREKKALKRQEEL